MKVTRVDGLEATVEALGVERIVSILLLHPRVPEVGEYVLVHLGQAMETVGEEEAKQAWSALEALFGDEFPMTLGTPMDS
jgi:hydrogenase expression/formation protein HypC